MRKLRLWLPPKREGSGESPLCVPMSSHFQVVRDDRNGCSRYRATKMLPVGSKLGWYRDSPRPYFRGGVYYFVNFYGGYIQYEQETLWCK